jgi:hypothetical protein
MMISFVCFVSMGVHNLTRFDNTSDNFTDGSKKLASASGRRPQTPALYE